VALDAAQARLLGKMMQDPTAFGDMWSGPGKAVYPAEVEEGTNWEGEVVQRLRAAVGLC